MSKLSSNIIIKQGLDIDKTMFTVPLIRKQNITVIVKGKMLNIGHGSIITTNRNAVSDDDGSITGYTIFTNTGGNCVHINVKDGKCSEIVYVFFDGKKDSLREIASSVIFEPIK